MFIGSALNPINSTLIATAKLPIGGQADFVDNSKLDGRLPAGHLDR